MVLVQKLPHTWGKRKIVPIEPLLTVVINEVLRLPGQIKTDLGTGWRVYETPKVENLGAQQRGSGGSWRGGEGR